MNARGTQIADAGRHLQVHWGPEQLMLLESSLVAKVARQARQRRLAQLSTLVVVAVLGASTWLLYRGAAPAASKPNLASASGAVAPRNPTAFRLRDGSKLEVSENADWLERTPAADPSPHVDIEVLRGRLRLSVVPHQPGEFRIHVGEVLVEVIGTVLTVERQAHEVSVAVEHGRVRVSRGTEAPTFLQAGERRTFVGHAARPALARDLKHVASAPEAASVPPAARPAPTSLREPSWQALARDGEYAAAYGKLHLDSVADVPGDLLLAADVARLSGHPAQAVKPLQRVAREHSADPRAALAAFTLGRVYLEELGNPRDAATAFRLTRSLQPGGPMVESALAREVESLARAGETQKAQALAQEYLSRFPNGSKRKLVQRHADAP